VPHHRPLLEVHLPGEPASVGLARALVRETVTGTRWEPKLDAIVSAVEDLVRTAVVEAAAATTLHIDSQGGRLRFTVRNPAASDVWVGALPGPEGFPSSPRVEEVADAWGLAETCAGMDVWFDVSAPA
jgi:hypothetical protein